MDEQNKCDVIKRLVDKNGNKDRAALTLGLSKRQVDRLIRAYKVKGKAAFVHGNRGRKPATTIPEQTRQTVVDLYLTKYYDTNFQHYTELIEKHEGVKVSPSAVVNILEAQYILFPMVTKAKKKRIRKELENKKAAAKTRKEADNIQINLVVVEVSHSRRPRAACFGELV